jgi:hypothetical protein
MECSAGRVAALGGRLLRGRPSRSRLGAMGARGRALGSCASGCAGRCAGAGRLAPWARTAPAPGLLGGRGRGTGRGRGFESWRPAGSVQVLARVTGCLWRLFSRRERGGERTGWEREGETRGRVAGIREGGGGCAEGAGRGLGQGRGGGRPCLMGLGRLG